MKDPLSLHCAGLACACLAALSCSSDRITADTAAPMSGNASPPSAADISSTPPPNSDESGTSAGTILVRKGIFPARPRGNSIVDPARVPARTDPSAPRGDSSAPSATPVLDVEVPDVAPPVVLGTLAGPGMQKAQANLNYYGSDLGFSFRHGEKLFMVFGDTWPDEQQVCRSDRPANDDTIAVLPREYTGGVPKPEFLTRTDSPNDLRFIQLYRGDESLSLGYGKAPLAVWSDGKRSYGMFERLEPHACDAAFANGSQACPTDDHFECSHDLGLCDPPIIPFPAPCQVGNDASCLPTQTCKAATLCVDPTNSQYTGDHYRDAERSVAHTIEIGVADDNAPEHYDSVLAFPTTKFAISNARTVAKFSGTAHGNDYSAGHDHLLVWGRPGLAAEYQHEAHLYLMSHRLPLETGPDGRLMFEPLYFAGTEPNGEPIWSHRQSEAKGIALDGHVNGDPHEAVQLLMTTHISWLGAPINKWVMLYGGDLVDWLLQDSQATRGARTPGALWIRFADNPWGPFSPPQPHVIPGSPLVVGDPIGPGGFIYRSECQNIGESMCARTDPHRPLEGLLGCPFSLDDPGRLYSPNIIEDYTHPNDQGGLDIIWNASTWNPYAVKLFRTSILPPGSRTLPQDEIGDAKALARMSNWRTLPELGEPHLYTQQSSYDRGTTDTSLPLSNHGNRDFNNFICKSADAEFGAQQLAPFKFDVAECEEDYVHGLVMSRFEGAGHMVRLWLGQLSLLAGPPASELLRIYVDDDPKPRVEVPLAEALDGRAGEIFAPPFGAGATNRLAWYYPVSFKKKLIVAVDKLGELDAIYYQCDVVSDEPSSDSLPTARLPEREAAQQQLSSVFRPAGTQPNLLEGTKISLRAGASRDIELAGPATIHELEVRVASADVASLMQVQARIRWDDEEQAAIDVSLADLLGGSVAPEISSLALTSIDEFGDRVLALKLPMPFRKRATLSLANTGRAAVDLELRLAGEHSVPSNAFGHLHVTRSETVGPTTVAERTALSVTGRGRFVGLCNEVEGHPDPAAGIQYDALNLLEGDFRAMIDGKLAINGTGSEETVDDVFYFKSAPFATPWAQAWGVVNDGSTPTARASFCSWNVLGRELDFHTSLDMRFELGGAANPSIVDRHKSVAYYYLAEP